MVLVDYIMNSNSFACRIFSAGLKAGHRVESCPCCGRPLDIDSLR
jgi:hypothetical protein